MFRVPHGMFGPTKSKNIRAVDKVLVSFVVCLRSGLWEVRFPERKVWGQTAEPETAKKS